MDEPTNGRTVSPTVSLCVHLWANPGCEKDLIAYEDVVLGMISDHGGQVINRAQTHGTVEQPDEIQILEFPSPESLENYLCDDRRLALTEIRDRVVARTEIIPVELIPFN